MREAVLGILLTLTVPASAAVQTDVGMLTCTIAEHGVKDTNPDSESRGMHCAFKPGGEGAEEVYVGEIKKVGTQSELGDKRVLIWAVMGPADRQLKPAVLAQTYVGKVAPDVSASRKPPKLLVGDRDDAYGLQSVSDEKGEEAAGSVTVIELRIKSTPG